MGESAGPGRTLRPTLDHRGNEVSDSNKHTQSDADESPGRVLNVQAVPRIVYPRNFIRQAVCELRFPTIFEIEDARPPESFWKVLRRQFQDHEVLANVNVRPGSVVTANAHQFKSKRGRWVVVLRPSAITLETARYGSFEEFEEQLQLVIAAAAETIDSEFFTRVGLRYVNVLPCQASSIDGWLNDQLARPLSEGTFGDVDFYWQQVHGKTAAGGYTFQHGINGSQEQLPSRTGYILDYDFFDQDVAVVDALATVKKLHELEHSLFSWTLGEKARDYLKK